VLQAKQEADGDTILHVPSRAWILSESELDLSCKRTRQAWILPENELDLSCKKTHNATGH
jgi:hypothetical protein